MKNAKRLDNHSRLTCDVTFSGRTLYKDGSWNTIYLPFQVGKTTHLADESCPLYGATIKQLDEKNCTFDKGVLTLSFTEAIPDGHNWSASNMPYVVKWESAGDDISDPVFKNVFVAYSDITASSDKCVNFKGLYSPKQMTDADNTILYLGYDDKESVSKLYYPSANTTISAFHGYFQLNGITAGDIAEARLFFGETTGIHPTPQSLSVNEKSGYYTIDGRRLSGKPTQKGVYIVNGKKTIIK